MRSIVTGVALLGLVACASQPAQNHPTSTAQSAKTGSQPITLAEARKRGLRIVDENGKTLYCRDEIATGSHMRKETLCLTAEQLETVRDASQRNVDQLQRIQPPPACGKTSKLGC